MKYNTLTNLTIILVSMIFINGCGEKKYADAKTALDESTKLMEEMVTGFDNAKSASDVAKAMNTYSDKMEKILPKIKKLNEKYPELNTSDTPPEELKESTEKAEAVSKKMSNAMMANIAYLNDPEVQKAQQHMAEILMKLNN